MADADGVPWFFAADFDPKKATIPELRNILVTYNIPYSNVAKKADYVALFLEHVWPQREQVLAQCAQVKRSSKGIADA